ncbi:MAG: hypothetical protein VR74_19820 [Hyphomonas sp. BRH_c22]|nr:MAG: hypothetical protein VR74_19820 [Hyphomonas sp. BRH_c22]
MAFTLEADFLSRPARPASEPGKKPLETDHKGADFRESLSKFDRVPPRDEEPESLNRTEAGQTSVSAILINVAQKTPEPDASPDGELLDLSLSADITLATRSSANELAPGLASAADLTSEMTDELVTDTRTADMITTSSSSTAGETLATPVSERALPVAAEIPASPAMASHEVSDPALQSKSESPSPPSDAANASNHTDTEPAVQSAPIGVAASLAAHSPTHTGSTDKVESTGTIATPASQSAAQATSGNASDHKQSDRDRFINDASLTDPELKASTPQRTDAASFSDIVTTDKPAASQDMSLGAPPFLLQNQAPQTATAPVPTGFTQTHALITATPAEVVDVISDSLASPDDRKNRIVVQLDPPELGRVSIDYKFDSQGLQHVTITGESPEAMRQLRLMHFELVNALEKQGLSGQNMSFQQQQAQQDPGQQTPRNGRIDADIAGNQELSAPVLVAAQTSRPGSTSSGGLNIKL